MYDVAVSAKANFVMRIDSHLLIPPVKIAFIGNPKKINTDKDLLLLERERLEFISDEYYAISELLNLRNRALLHLNIMEARLICINYFDPVTRCKDCPIAKAGHPECENTPFEKIIDIETKIETELTAQLFSELFFMVQCSKIFIEQMLKSIDTLKCHMLK